MGNESIRYLIVPGWQGSSDDHWQTHWQNSLPNSARVEQADWLTPRREDWIAALAEAIAADSTPVILIAHSLGCITVAHWADRAPASLLSQVRGALLVAPADVERPTCAPALRNFARSRRTLCRLRAKSSAQTTMRRPVHLALWNSPANGAPRLAFSAEPDTLTSSLAINAGNKVSPSYTACKPVLSTAPCAAPEFFVTPAPIHRRRAGARHEPA